MPKDWQATQLRSIQIWFGFLLGWIVVLLTVVNLLERRYEKDPAGNGAKLE